MSIADPEPHDASRVRRRTPRTPRVYVTAADHRRLSQLIGAAGAPAGAELLAHELERAVVVAEETTRRFVRIGSIVLFEDRPSGRIRTLQVVLPAEADIDAGRISVLAPVGAALFGLGEGDSFTWSADARSVHVLTVTHA